MIPKLIMKGVSEMKKFSLYNFRYARDGKTMYANISELTGDDKPFWDIHEMKFIIFSPLTKIERVWELNKIRNNPNGGDVALWEFKPVDKDYQGRTKLVIFNC